MIKDIVKNLYVQLIYSKEFEFFMSYRNNIYLIYFNTQTKYFPFFFTSKKITHTLYDMHI